MGSMPMQVYWRRPVVDRAADAEATQLAVEGLRDLGAAPILMKSDLNLFAGHVRLRCRNTPLEACHSVHIS
jgi:hypothetical protein